MKPLMIQTLAVALLAGSTLSAVPAIAQTEAPAGGQGGGGSGTTILPRQGTGNQGSSGAATPDSGAAGAPSRAQPPQGTESTTQQQQPSGNGSGSSNAQTRGTDQGTGTAQQPGGQAGQSDGSTAGGSDSGARTPDNARQEGGAQQQAPDRADTNRPSGETTGSVNITNEQRTEIRNVIVRDRVRPADINVNVDVGVAIPRTVVLHPLPPRIVEILPAYRGYEYFVLADGRIIIVDPRTHEIVYILVG